MALMALNQLPNHEMGGERKEVRSNRLKEVRGERAEYGWYLLGRERCGGVESRRWL